MRLFVVVCKDTKTGHKMVARDVSFNVALDWLQRRQRECGRDVFRVDSDDINHYTIYTGKAVDGYDMNGNPEKFYTDIDKYWYDEERGYLLGE